MCTQVWVMAWPRISEQKHFQGVCGRELMLGAEIGAAFEISTSICLCISVLSTVASGKFYLIRSSSQEGPKSSSLYLCLTRPDLLKLCDLCLQAVLWAWIF